MVSVTCFPQFKNFGFLLEWIFTNLRIESFLVTFAGTNFCEIDQNPGNLT